ncbi:hypothetical protein Tco_0984825 [Tanacetum coccineum]
MRISLTTTTFESVRAIKSKIYMGDDNLIDSESCRFDQLLNIEPDIFTYDINMQGSYKEINTNQEMSKEYESVKEINLEQHLGPTEKRVHWCQTISQEKDGVREYWALCDPYNDICDGGSLPNDVGKLYWESTNDNERVDFEWEELSFNNWGEEKEDHEELKTNVVLEIILDKMDETWFSSTSNDMDDLEGVIDYLEPNLYNRFTGLGNERKCKLLEIIYGEPPPILIERVKVTRYNIGLGETYTKTNILGIDEIPRTSTNVATVRVVLMDELGAEGSAQGAT